MVFSIAKDKILVERILNSGEIVRKKYPVKDGRVEIKRGGLGHGDKKYSPKLDPSCIADEWHSYGTFAPLWNALLGKHRKVYYLDGAKELSPILPKGPAPVFSVDDYVKAADAKLLEKQAKTAGQTTTIETITLIGVVVLAFMIWVLWLNNGVVNIG